ncbi:MAG: DUF5916 domain-containing protein [Bacteroidota bacterium]|nr:DUF5916 domain-containing protein [Bacteroidota bacterium]
MKIVKLLCAVMFSFSFTSSAQFLQSVRAVKLTEPIILDGKLTESVWKSVPPITEFKQREPEQDSAASERTEVWIAYSEDALYIGARMYDSHPDSIMKVLSRRDNTITSDWFAVFIDSYHDQRSGNFFAVSAAGTVVDGVLYNDDWNSTDWDGVWEVKANIDEQGWTAEIKIPLSQLRFHDNTNQVWGINFERDIGRKNESDYLVYTPRNGSGFVSRFPTLTGIDGVKSSSRAELLPFLTTKAEYTHPSAGDPFNNGSRYSPEFGADLRYALSGNLVLNATVNPDFGQVEVDPAVVNLTDVESFFQEKRPFFVEGANIFTNFGQGGGRNFWNANFSGPILFYSRRVGRTPHGNDTLNNADHVDMPIATQILGAGKITGKIGDQWNVGTIHAVTAREFAPFQINGVRGEAEVEPLTYYGVARVQRDFDEGRHGIGILGTVTSRQFSVSPTGRELSSNLNSNGLFSGVDGWTFLDDEKAWVITGWSGLSFVDGSRTRLLNLQTNSQHYFQRPDINHVHMDSSATSMTGYAGRMYLIKQRGNFFFNSAIGVIDPKFEVNDIGFLGRTDIINMHIGAGYNWPDPDGIFRRKELGGLLYQTNDFSGNNTGRGFFHFGSVQFKNYYGVNWGFGFGPDNINQRRTRGGPLTLNTPYIEYNITINSDDRKEVYVQLNGNGNSSTQSVYKYIDVTLQYRPVPNITLSVTPSYEFGFNALQYVQTFDDPLAVNTYGKRYVFGELTQNTFGAGFRLNWTFTPTVSLQLYMQPLISSGSYEKFKELKRPKTNDYLVYGTQNSTISKSGNDYTVNPNGTGSAQPITFSDPNFNYKSLRGNAVLRWEYLPGSALYFVWTQSRSDEEKIGSFLFNHSLRRLAEANADNIFMIKLSYYFNI